MDILELRREFIHYLRTHYTYAHPDIKASNVLYAYHNNIGMPFWEIFASEASMEAARELLYRCFVQKGRKNPRQHTQVVYGDWTLFREFLSAAGYAPAPSEAPRPSGGQALIDAGATEQDQRFMREAIRLARQAVEHGNEPFGAVLVRNGEMVYSNENQIYSGSDPTFHAEAGLLRRFCRETGVTDLRDYTLYSSCEPCFMCSGAMVWVKLGRLVYGASDIDLCGLLGERGSRCSTLVFQHSSHRPAVTAGVLREESLEVLSAYFRTHQKG